MSPTVIALMLTASLCAGWVDAVVGGGGLILLPLIMILNPGFTYAQALGVNKIAAICGTGSSAIIMARRVPAARTAFRYAPLAFIGAALGAVIASARLSCSGHRLGRSQSDGPSRVDVGLRHWC